MFRPVAIVVSSGCRPQRRKNMVETGGDLSASGSPCAHLECARNDKRRSRSSVEDPESGVLGGVAAHAGSVGRDSASKMFNARQPSTGPSRRSPYTSESLKDRVESQGRAAN